MNKVITTETVTAYAVCSRKAVFLLRGNPKGSLHEYERVLSERAERRRQEYLIDLPNNELPALPFAKTETPVLSILNSAHIVASKELVASCDALVNKKPGRSGAHAYFEPHLVLGSHTVNSQQKLAIAFAGYVVGNINKDLPTTGSAVPFGSKPRRVQLSTLYPKVRSIITNLRQFINGSLTEPPPLYLNRNCVTCRYYDHCYHEAEAADHLTLLERMSPKLLRQYAKKGVFTVNQLSYLFKPRRRRKRSKKAQPSFNIQLQAFSIRMKKIYLYEPPTLKKQPIELYLDIEGIPDQDFNYLIGLLINECESTTKRSFWANTSEDECEIFQECINLLKQYPDAPIYHYGSYESRAFQKAGTKYNVDCTEIIARLVNVNSFIFGKIYFPTRSNRLKEFGKYIGASWSAPNPSGLQSIVWRNRWEDTGKDRYKEMLLSYNSEDCEAVCLLTREIQNLASSANVRPDVGFPTTSKTNTTEIGKDVHDIFDRILKSAHLEYEKKRIKLKSDDGCLPQKRAHSICRQRAPRSFPARVGKIINVPRKRKCINCPNQQLRTSKKFAEHVGIDLVFTNSGCRKKIIKHIGHFAGCPVCHYYHSPPGVKRLKGQVFGRGFCCWTAYMRIALRLPYQLIANVAEAMLFEHVSPSSAGDMMSRIAKEYDCTDKILRNRILRSSIIHTDETKINIRGVNHYAWVLTDGKHVLFKLSETRQISAIEPILDDYGGVLVSDFYPGFDSLSCRQQKCLVHLIRDLNDDLWSNPFNEDYETFAVTVRDLFMPIFHDVYRWGLKARYLRKHMKSVDRFYSRVIEVTERRSEIVDKYIKRFNRYRESLFLFLTEDGIPWNNNMAERALRHLSVQQKISGCFVGEGATEYLRLLEICQTCRFQDKPFLQFLLSGERDVDLFKFRKSGQKSVSP